MIDVYLLSSKLLSELELAKELHEESELEGGESTPIPRELMENYHKYDLSNTELAIVLMFMTYAYKGTYTYEEIIKEIIENTLKHLNFRYSPQLEKLKIMDSLN